MSGTRVASLNVTKNTTAADLQAFADKLGNGDRLRGRKVEGGYELYAKTGKPGLWKRMTGQTRSDARAAVRMATHSIERNMGGKTLHNVRDAMDRGIRDHKGDVRNKDIRGEQFQHLASASGRSDVAHKHIADVRVGVLDNRGPGFGSLSRDIQNRIVESVLLELNKIPPTGHATHDGRPSFGRIGDAIADGVRSNLDAIKNEPKGAAFLTRLEMSSGAAFSYDLRQAVMSHPNGKKSFDSDIGRKCFEDAFRSIEPDLVSNKETSSGRIEINGEAFTKGKLLGQGGNGAVHLYTSASDPTKQIVLKTVIQNGPVPPPTNEEMKREVNVHRAAIGPGSGAANVVGLVGMVHMSDGTIGIAIENAKHGNATNVRDKIADALNGGSISGAEAKAMRLLLLRDMATGLAHMGRQGKDIVHFDFKNDNVFVGDGGVAKVGDFGLTAKRDRLDFAAHAIPDAPLQIGPELHRASSESAATSTARNRTNYDRTDDEKKIVFETRKNSIKELFKGLTDGQCEALAQSQQEGEGAIEKRNISSVAADKVDAWAFGQAAFQMMLGRDMHEASFLSGLGARVGKFGHTTSAQDASGQVRVVDRSNDRAIDVNTPDATAGQDWIHRDEGFFGGSTGDGRIDNLINGLLHPDPGQRMTIEQALKHPALTMSDQEVGAARQNLLSVLNISANPATQPSAPPPATLQATPQAGVGIPTPPGSPTSGDFQMFTDDVLSQMQQAFLGQRI